MGPSASSKLAAHGAGEQRCRMLDQLAELAVIGDEAPATVKHHATGILHWSIQLLEAEYFKARPKKLIEICQARNQKYGIIVRKLDFPSSAAADEVVWATRSGYGSRSRSGRHSRKPCATSPSAS